MSAIRYLDEIPRLKGAKHRVLVNAEYNDRGDAVFEHYADVCDQGPVDLFAIEQLLEGDDVWVGEGSVWALPAGWDDGVEIFVTGITSFDGDQPVEVNRALAFMIGQQLPGYPSAGFIRSELKGKRLVIGGERGDITHADVLVAVAASREWKP
jgi:hypothetical protein